MTFNQRVVMYTKKIPHQRVATYGQIAALCGAPRAARAVGWALHGLTDSELRFVPWYRVVNRQGRISTTCREHNAVLQATLLKKDGILVQYRNGNYFVDLKKFIWKF